MHVGICISQFYFKLFILFLLILIKKIIFFILDIEMVKARENTAAHNVHQYLVVGRATPTEKNPSPKIYKMRIFANDSVRAKSKFWYFLKRLNKIRKVVGEILSVNEVNILNQK